MTTGDSGAEPRPSPVRYCFACGAENEFSERVCRSCGKSLQATPRQRREGIAFLLNELEEMRAWRELPPDRYQALRAHYRQALGLDRPPPPPSAAEPAPREELQKAPGGAPEPPPRTMVPSRPPPARRAEGPSWLAEQQANLLLYLGAFLMVIAALIFVSYAEQGINAGVRMALLVTYTLVFGAAGLVSMRFPRVRQAGVVFFAVCALMVPLNFAALHVFFFADDGIDPAGLWLAGSIASGLFYGAAAVGGVSRWYAGPAVVAYYSAVAALLRVIGVAPDVYPPVFVAASFPLLVPFFFDLGDVGKVFAARAYIAANLVVPGAVLTALALIGPAVSDATELIDMLGLWYLPATLALAAGFHGRLALGPKLAPDIDERRYWHAPVALATSGGAVLGLLGALSAPAEAYPITTAGLALGLLVPWLLPPRRAEVFGEPALWVANAGMPLAVLTGLALIDAPAASTHWYLPPVLGLGGVFYLIVGVGLREKWPAYASGIGLLGALGAVLAVAGAPAAAYPGTFVAGAIALSIPALVSIRKVSDIAASAWAGLAHVVVPAAAIAGLLIAGAAGGDTVPEVYTRWFLPGAWGTGVVFYALHAWRAGTVLRIERFRLLLILASLCTAAGASVTVTYALDVGHEWYGPTLAIVAVAFAGGSERSGPAWEGRRYLEWLALATMTTAWVLFEGVYADAPRLGAGVHFAAAALYLLAARLTDATLDIDLRFAREQDGGVLRLPAATALVYAAGLTAGLGFYFLLASLPAAEGATAEDAAWPYFGLSAGIALVAASMRLWWHEARLHAYVIALGMSMFVLLSSVQAQGDVALLLTLYTGLALALVLWEREPEALALPATYGFFGVLAAWRFFEPNDTYLPLVLSGVGAALVAAFLLVESWEKRWATDIELVAFAYLVAAPIAGWVRLNYLADEQGFVDGVHFAETGIFRSSGLSVLVLGGAVAGHAWLRKHLALGAGASAILLAGILLEIAHLRPDNVQAYTAPLGLYVLALGLGAARVRDLPRDLGQLGQPAQAVGALVLMGPSLEQAWGDDGGVLAVLLLVEAIALLALALVQRGLWLLATSTGFIVLDGLRYLFDAARALPNWMTVAIAGLVLIGAGVTILLTREQWTRWQDEVRSWWYREAPAGESGPEG